MSIYEIDPIADPRWPELLQRHPDASVFHTPAWLSALRESYGYRCLGLTTAAPDQPLQNGIAFCEVRSWLTGSRMVSLPFADHCQPLLNQPSDLIEFLQFFRRRLGNDGWRYLEFRPLAAIPEIEQQSGLSKSAEYCLHRLDVRPDVDSLLRSFHRTSIREEVRRAKREGIVVDAGRSEPYLRALYRIRLNTRRRQGLPPQPLAWYRALIGLFGEDVTIWTGTLKNEIIGALLTVRFKDTLVFKYGGSEERYHNLGCVPYIYWHAIQHAKAVGTTKVDFGRSDLSTPGLILFKDRWGAQKTTLKYFRMSNGTPQDSRPLGTNRVFSMMPDFCLSAAGRFLYRHMG